MAPSGRPPLHSSWCEAESHTCDACEPDHLTLESWRTFTNETKTFCSFYLLLILVMGDVHPAVIVHYSNFQCLSRRFLCIQLR